MKNHSLPTGQKKQAGNCPPVAAVVSLAAKNSGPHRSKAFLNYSGYRLGRMFHKNYSRNIIFCNRPPVNLFHFTGSNNPHYLSPSSMRSEEHTSELQSRPHLVCRLLLEKKKKKNIH